MTEDLNAMTVFVAVAEARGFRAAGGRLGVTASAVSQAVRRLEERLGVVLVQRTTRSVRLTEAGERLFAAVGLAMLYESQVREDVARGELVPVLEEFSAPFPGFYLYYPQRRQASAALRALIEHLRGARSPARRRGRRPAR